MQIVSRHFANGVDNSLDKSELNFLTSNNELSLLSSQFCSSLSLKSDGRLERQEQRPSQSSQRATNTCILRIGKDSLNFIKFETGLYIAELMKSSDLGHLCVGDRVVSVNGQLLKNKTIFSVLKLFSNSCADYFDLEISPSGSSSSSDDQVESERRRQKSSIGMTGGMMEFHQSQEETDEKHEENESDNDSLAQEEEEAIRLSAMFNSMKSSDKVRPLYGQCHSHSDDDQSTS
jgi:hypothetical protein